MWYFIKYYCTGVCCSSDIYAILFTVWAVATTASLGIAENSIFAVALFMNMLVPIMDRYLVWRPWSLGGVRNASKN